MQNRYWGSMSDTAQSPNKSMAEQSESMVTRAKELFVRVKGHFKANNASVVSAGVAFYATVAIVPALIVLVTIYGLVVTPQEVQRQIQSLASVLPSEVRKLLTDQLTSIVDTSSGALSVTLVVATLISLWSASRGMQALMAALNVAFSERESRGFVKLHATAFILTLVTLFILIGMLLILIMGPGFLGYLGLDRLENAFVGVGEWLVLIAACFVWFVLVLRFGPARDQPRWYWLTFGNLLALGVWLGATLLFSVFVSYFGSYNKTYGVLAGAIVVLVWLNLSARCILLGATINAKLDR